MKKAINFLKKDKHMRKIIESVEAPEFNKDRGTYFEILAKSIVFQQLAGKAANTIYYRLKRECGRITPENVTDLTIAKMREAGLSQRKSEYIKDLAEKFLNGIIMPRKLNSMTNEEVTKTLTKVRGVGLWTAEMFLMFGLGREDVFSPGDYGLRKAIQKLFFFEELPTEKEAAKIAERWSPYRTLASLYLWKSLD